MGAFFIMSISAWYLLKRRHGDFARRSFDGALALATVSSIAMVVSGHFQAHAVYENQPAKLAAFEGHFHTGPGDLSLIGVPDAETETLRGGVSIPGGLGLLLKNDPDATIVGLDRFHDEDRPPLFISFASYHVMVALGFFFVALTLAAAFLRWRRRLYDARWLLWIFVPAVIGPVIANEIGWIAAEVGRQPWIVHPPVGWTAEGDVVVGEDGLVHYDETLGLRTSNAVSPSVRANQVLGSIIGFSLIYIGLGAVWVFVLDRKIKHGPDADVPTPPESDGLAGAAGARASGERLTGERTDEKG
jgi:cytochrome d ubiquinol oxidase subunit I